MGVDGKGTVTLKVLLVKGKHTLFLWCFPGSPFVMPFCKGDVANPSRRSTGLVRSGSWGVLFSSFCVCLGLLECFLPPASILLPGAWEAQQVAPAPPWALMELLVVPQGSSGWQCSSLSHPQFCQSLCLQRWCDHLPI